MTADSTPDMTVGAVFASRAPGPSDAEARRLHEQRAASAAHAAATLPLGSAEQREAAQFAAEARARSSALGNHSRAAKDERLRTRNIERANGADAR